MLSEHILTLFQRHFHVLFLKKHALAVSCLAVTLQMMSNNHRSFSPVVSIAENKKNCDNHSVVNVMLDCFISLVT
jgi:hypothetical protein